MANYGIKISKPSSDVKTATDKDVIFTSKYRSLKVLKWGNFTFNVPDTGNYTHTIAHGLSYAPAFDVFTKGTAAFSFLTASTYADAWFNVGGSNRWFQQDGHGGIFAYTDSTNLTIQSVGVFKSTTITGRYYIYVDPCQEYTSTNNYNLTGDYGMKVSKAGQDVKETNKEYNMAFSTKYNSIQYYSESVKEKNLTLPILFASPKDMTPEEATYVDFTHGLGYAPYFQAFYETSSELRQLPYTLNKDYGDYEYDPNWNAFEVSAWADATRIRVTFWRRSGWSWLGDPMLNVTWPATTINVKVFPFAENLGGLSG